MTHSIFLAISLASKSYLHFLTGCSISKQSKLARNLLQLQKKVSEPNTLNVIGKQKEGRLKDAKLFFFKKIFNFVQCREKMQVLHITSVKYKSLKTKSVFKVQQMYFETYFETKDKFSTC